MAGSNPPTGVISLDVCCRPFAREEELYLAKRKAHLHLGDDRTLLKLFQNIPVGIFVKIFIEKDWTNENRVPSSSQTIVFGDLNNFSISQ